MIMPPITDIQRSAVPYLERLVASHDRLLAAAKSFVTAGDDLGSKGKSVNLQTHYDNFQAAIAAAEERET
jgi:hypothetical protein